MELRSFRFYRERFCGRNLIWRGFIQSLELLKLDYENNPEVDDLNEVWSKDDIEFQDEYGISRATIIDEDRKININQIAAGKNLGVLEKFFPSELAQSIIDWVDKDNIQDYPDGGEQDNYYNFLKYNCRNSDMRSLYEIKYIKGYSPDFDLKNIEAQITVIGSGKEININTAPEACFKALGLPNLLVAKILEFRQYSGVFNNIPDNISEIFPEFAGTEVENQWAVLRKHFKVNSEYFRIYITAQTRRGVKRYAQAVVQRRGGRFDIILWQENFWEK